LLDDSESLLFRGLSNARPWSIELTLETLGRSLGYVRRLKYRKRTRGYKARAPKSAEQRQTDLAQLRSVLYGDQCQESARRVQERLQTALDFNREWAAEFVLLKLGQSRGYIKEPPRWPTMVRIEPPVWMHMGPEEREEYIRRCAEEAAASPDFRPATVEPATADAPSCGNEAVTSSSLSPALRGEGKDEGSAADVSRSCDALPLTPALSPQSRGEGERGALPTPTLSASAQLQYNTTAGQQLQPTSPPPLDWLTFKHATFQRFKHDYRRAFDMPNPLDTSGKFSNNRHKQMCILPSKSKDPQTSQASGSQGNKPPP
jgi:hypothetical protein